MEKSVSVDTIPPLVTLFVRRYTRELFPPCTTKCPLLSGGAKVNVPPDPDRLRFSVFVSRSSTLESKGSVILSTLARVVNSCAPTISPTARSDLGQKRVVSLDP